MILNFIRLALAGFVLLSVTGCAPAVADHGEQLGACTITDGDTIRCGDERIRLLAIDTPEMPGHCRRGRRCVEGDPHAAKRGLEQLTAGAALTITRVGEDRYGRTLGLVRADGADLSCHQLEVGHAEYRKDWDNGGRVAAICPEVAG